MVEMDVAGPSRMSVAVRCYMSPRVRERRGCAAAQIRLVMTFPVTFREICISIDSSNIGRDGNALVYRWGKRRSRRFINPHAPIRSSDSEPGPLPGRPSYINPHRSMVPVLHVSSFACSVRCVLRLHILACSSEQKKFQFSPARTT